MSDVIHGDEELMRKLNLLQTSVPGGIGKALLSGAFALEGFIKQSMQEGHHGRTYRRGKRLHRASAPGETPAIDYGFLVNSIQSGMAEDGAAEVSTNSDAAPHLEFGTAYMEARPFLRPAVDEHGDRVSAVVRAAVVRLVEDAVK